jgi:hypothetical protein
MSFIKIGKQSVEMVRDHELEHCIAKKLQPLVVEVEGFALKGQAGVGQCFGEEEGIAKLVTDTPL